MGKESLGRRDIINVGGIWGSPVFGEQRIRRNARGEKLPIIGYFGTQEARMRGSINGEFSGGRDIQLCGDYKVQ